MRTSEIFFDRVYLKHFRTGLPRNKNAVTIAVGSIGEDVYVGVAVCSKRDSFCRKIGRDIAVGRAKAAAQGRLLVGMNGYSCAPLGDSKVFYEKAALIAEHIVKKLPLKATQRVSAVNYDYLPKGTLYFFFDDCDDYSVASAV